MSNENTNNSGIKVEFGKITVDHVEPNPYKDAMDQAQIRQTVTKTYPSGRVSSSKSDSLFDADDFDLEEGASYTSTRVTWLNVPKGTTVADVKAKLRALPDARIRKELANDVMLVLTEEQENAIKNDEINFTFEKAQEKLRICDKDGVAIEPAQYSQNFFSAKGEVDGDYRTMVSEKEAVQSIANDALEA